MAINWSDNKKVQEARLKAIQAGYKPAEVDEYIQVNQAAAGIASGKSSLTLDDLPQDQRAQVDIALQAMGYTPESLKEKESKKGKEKISTNAKNVLDLIQRKQKGEKIEDYDTQLAFLTSEYNTKGFQEGGKALTAPERGILSGSMVALEDRVPTLFDKIKSQFTGYTAPTKSRVSDSEEVIRTKMVKALEASDPELAKQYKNSSKKEQKGIIDGILAYNEKLNTPEKQKQVADNRARGMETLQNIVPDAINIGKNLVGAAPTIGKTLLGEAKNQAGLGFNMPTEDTQNMIEGGIRGAGESYKRTFTDPEYNREHPTEALLNLLPFLGGMKGVNGVRGAGTIDDVARTPIDDAAKLPVDDAVRNTSTLDKVTPALVDVLEQGKNKMNQTGTNLRSKVRDIEEPAGIYGATREKQINATMNELGIGGSPEAQYEKLLPEVQKLSSKIEKEIINDPAEFNMDDIVKQFKVNAKKELRTEGFNNKTVQKEVKGYIQDVYGERIGDTISAGDLFSLKKELNKDYGTVARKRKNNVPLTDREKVVFIARQTVDDLITERYPKVKKATLQQSDLYDAADSLAKRRKDDVRIDLPLVNKIPLPTNAIFSGTDYLGRLLQGR